jgi:hypothetical protein
MLISHFAGRKAGEKFKSVRAWKSGDQMIRMTLNMICDTLFLNVSYDPESANPEI